MKKIGVIFMLLGWILTLAACEERDGPGEASDDTPDQEEERDNDQEEEEEPFPDFEVGIEDTTLRMKAGEDAPWIDILDLTYLSGDGSPGDLRREEGLIQWKHTESDDHAPLVSVHALVGLQEATLDPGEARLRRHVDRLEYFDASDDTWRLLFNLGLVHEGYVLSQDSDGTPLRYGSFASRIPLLETFGHFEGHARLEGVPVSEARYDEASELYLPIGYDAGHIIEGTLTNRVDECEIPGEQYCYEGTMNFEFGDDGTDTLIRPDDLGWGAIGSLSVTVDAIGDESTIEVKPENSDDVLGTIDETGTHTFEAPSTELARLTMDLSAKAGETIGIREVTLYDTFDDEHSHYDATDLESWMLYGSNAEKADSGRSGVVADFEYDSYEAEIGLDTFGISDKRYETVLDRFSDDCGEPSDHPDAPDNDDMWVFGETCPIKEVLGKEDEVTGPDGQEYFMLRVKAERYRLDGFEKMPFAFFGTLHDGTPRLADTTVEEVIMDDDTDVIQRGAFAHAADLERITLPDTLTDIERQAFYRAESLESLTLPEGLGTIGVEAFRYTKSLKQLTLPSTLKTIEAFAFAGSAIGSLDLPEGVDAIERGAFFGSELETLTLPGTVDTLYDETFTRTQSLKTLIIENDDVVPIKDANYSPDLDDDEWGHAFHMTNPDLRIYVPDSSLSDYQAHPSWTHAAEYLAPMSDLE